MGGSLEAIVDLCRMEDLLALHVTVMLLVVNLSMEMVSLVFLLLVMMLWV